MIEIAGLVLTGISLATDLASRHKDLTAWDTQELEVDRHWLALATENELLDGVEADYVWAAARSVASRELRGSHEVVLAHNDEKKTIHRIVRGRAAGQTVLMRKVS